MRRTEHFKVFFAKSFINSMIQSSDVNFCLSYGPVHKTSNNLVCANSKASDQPTHTRSLMPLLVA